MPDVRVVVPTLGRRLDWLTESLASIRDQAVPLELVVVGPSDADAGRRIAKTFGARWLNEEGRTLSDAVNQGLQDATCEFVAWLGDDDLLSPNSLARSTRALASNPRASMTYGQIRCIDSSGKTLFWIRPGNLAKHWMRIGHDFVPQPGAIFRRSKLELAGPLDPTLKQAMDLDLFLRLRLEGPLIYIPYEVASFRRHADSITVSNTSPGAEAREVRQRYLGQGCQRAERLLFPIIDAVGRLWAKGFAHDFRRSSQ